MRARRAADQQACQAYANSQTAPLSAQANNQALGSTLLTTALGAGLGAAIGGGHGAAIGAASGAVAGTAVGVGPNAYANYGLQQRYDIAYAQCMYGKGNQLPGYSYAPQYAPSTMPPPPPPPPPPQG